MNKLSEFAKKSTFLIKVILGHQEKEFQSNWLRVEQRLRRLEHAREKMEGMKKVREQKLLLELRHMVEDVRKVAKEFDDMEAVNEDFLNRIDNQARIIKDLQNVLGEEEIKMRELIEDHRRISSK